MGTAQRAKRLIVVGVDGSALSEEALGWAIDEAARTGADVEAVIAYYWFPLPIKDVDCKGLALRVLGDAIHGVSRPARPVQVVQRVVEGDAGKALLDAAATADLLVIGSRGRHDRTGPPLGSVAQYCIKHAPCPVAVIRGPRLTAAG